MQKNHLDFITGRYRPVLCFALKMLRLRYRIESLYQSSHLVPRRRTEPPSSPWTYRMIREWVEVCQNDHNAFSHSFISNSKVFQPTRLIDVGLREEGYILPRIVETSCNTPVKYVTLSHRWAKLHTLITTQTNISDHRLKLPMDKMPPTFKDAMEVTRQLGFQYRCIDSL